MIALLAATGKWNVYERGWMVRVRAITSAGAEARSPCYRSLMLRTRMKQRAALVERAVGRLADVQASIAGLDDEDLLDLADILSGKTETVLWEMASAEMLKRQISL